MTVRIPRLRTFGAVGLAAALGATGLTLLGSQASQASSHREAPAIAGDPQADNTDTYAFVSPDKQDTVTLLANWYPFQEPNGGPNFYPFATDARYNIKIDNTGTGVAGITYQWTFRNDDKRGSDTFLYDNGPVASLDDPHLLFKQRYTLKKITAAGTTTLIDDAIAAPSFTGKASMPDYGKLRDQATRDLPGGGKVYAGGAADSFFVDLRVFDLLFGANLKEVGQNTLKGYNVNTLALQIPKSELALKGDATRNPVIGVWATTDRRTTSVLGGGADQATGSGKSCSLPLAGFCPPGFAASKSVQLLGDSSDSGWTQVSRLGNPLVNEVVAAAGMKDKFNRTAPADDHNWPELVDRVLNPEVPKLVQGIYGLAAPATPRKDLAEIFLTGIAKGNGPIDADLNGFKLNQDADQAAMVPAEVEHLNMGVAVTPQPNRLGVLAGDFQGFPNGRRLTDDVVSIELQALEGAAQQLPVAIVKALAAGDGVNKAGKDFTAQFPYAPSPYESAVNAR